MRNKVNSFPIHTIFWSPAVLKFSYHTAVVLLVYLPHCLTHQNSLGSTSLMGRNDQMFLKYNSEYEGCSNMNASSFITFFTYMLRQNVIPFWKALFVVFKMAPNIKKY